MTSLPPATGRLDDPRAVDLWTLPEHRVQELALTMGGLDLLTPDEHSRHRRLLRDASRNHFLGGRLLCRLALSARTGLPPDTWRFTVTDHGRPELTADHDGLRFNLSHTDGLIVCVVTQGRGCGVDVERVPFDDEKTRLLNARFDDVQRAAVAGAPDPAAALAELWVLTEAYLKGLGTGLVNGLGALRFTRRPGVAGLVVTDGRRPGAGRRWRLELVRPGPGHLLAVAVDDGGAGRLRRHNLADAERFSRGLWPADRPAPVSP